MRSIVEGLNRRLQRRWVPKWHFAFADNTHGGFHERIAEKFKPLDMGYKRLHPQCRQIAVYSHSTTIPEGRDYSDDLKERFKFLVASFRTDKNGWRFAVKDDGGPHDNHYDLYAHAFVIFTLSLYYRATYQEGAARLAKETLTFIDKHFRAKIGFYEALDENLAPIERIRRQDPHMHLLEACLFAYDTFGDQSYFEIADDLYGLFKDYFYDSKTQTLGEYFDNDLKPHPEKGDLVQPGHHFEWVWLLQKYKRVKPDHDPEIDAIMHNLLKWGNTYGWDEEYGGIYDTLTRDGKIVADTKRIWPFSEALKANALMLDEDTDKDFIKERTKKMVEVFRTKYILERGFWTEVLNRDLTPQTDYLPSSTPYHLYFGIVETLDYLRARGPSRSWTLGIMNFLYAIRRNLSRFTQKILCYIR